MAKETPPANALVITLAGEIDIYNVSSLEKLLAPAYECADVIIDMNDVRYLDSSALTVFVRMRKRRLIADFPPCRLVGLNPNIRRLFALTHLDEIWPIYSTVQAALKSFELVS